MSVRRIMAKDNAVEKKTYMIENWATDFGLLVSLSNNLLLTVNCKLRQTFISAQLWIFFFKKFLRTERGNQNSRWKLRALQVHGDNPSNEIKWNQKKSQAATATKHKSFHNWEPAGACWFASGVGNSRQLRDYSRVAQTLSSPSCNQRQTSWARQEKGWNGKWNELAQSHAK